MAKRKFEVGDRVLHLVYGNGTVLKYNGVGYYNVKFDMYGFPFEIYSGNANKLVKFCDEQLELIL